MSKKPKSMSLPEVRGCINRLIYRPHKTQTDPELLTIVLLRKKEHHLGFLEGYTKLRSTGRWQEVKDNRIIRTYLDEKNVNLEIQFRDRKDEAVGHHLIDLFTELNERRIKEDLLYCRTMPIEETTL